MWRQLWEVCEGNVSWTQGAAKDIMAKVRAISEEGWPRALTADEAKSWTDVSAKRMRAMARHLSEAVRRERRWALNLVGPAEMAEPSEQAESDGEPAPAAAAKAEAEAPAAAAPEQVKRRRTSKTAGDESAEAWAFGCDTEMRNGWRMGAASGMRKDFALRIEADPQSGDDGHPIAV